MITIANFYTMYCSKQSDRPRVEWYTCEKTEECPLYKRGQCACNNIPFGSYSCPNAQFHRDVGPTKRARSFNDWIFDHKDNIKPTAKVDSGKIAKVAGYYYLPMSFLMDAANSLEGVTDNHFVKEDDFNEDFVQKIVEFVPLTWFDRVPIKNYKEEQVPIFIQQLMEEFPDIYKKWKEKYPNTADKFTELSPVGRKIFIESLPTGAVIHESKGNFVKQGDKLVCSEYKSAFIPFNAKSAVLEISITPDMVTEVTEGLDVGDNPRFVN